MKVVKNDSATGRINPIRVSGSCPPLSTQARLAVREPPSAAQPHRPRLRQAPPDRPRGRRARRRQLCRRLGWGPTAAWYRNILHTPDVTIQVGTRTIPVTAIPLDKEQGAQVFVRYGSRHRTAAKYVLPRVLGFSVDGSDADFRAVGQQLALRPVRPSGRSLRSHRYAAGTVTRTSAIRSRQKPWPRTAFAHRETIGADTTRVPRLAKVPQPGQ